ncbi:hypothetical protein MRX96_046317 [Rhipicephalus microplus]
MIPNSGRSERSAVEDRSPKSGGRWREEQFMKDPALTAETPRVVGGNHRLPVTAELRTHQRNRRSVTEASVGQCLGQKMIPNSGRSERSAVEDRSPKSGGRWREEQFMKDPALTAETPRVVGGNHRLPVTAELRTHQRNR